MSSSLSKSERVASLLQEVHALVSGPDDSQAAADTVEVLCELACMLAGAHHGPKRLREKTEHCHRIKAVGYPPALSLRVDICRGADGYVTHVFDPDEQKEAWHTWDVWNS